MTLANWWSLDHPQGPPVQGARIMTQGLRWVSPDSVGAEWLWELSRRFCLSGRVCLLSKSRLTSQFL